jgi:hypothetical protein
MSCSMLLNCYTIFGFAHADENNPLIVDFVFGSIAAHTVKYGCVHERKLRQSDFPIRGTEVFRGHCAADSIKGAGDRACGKLSRSCDLTR